MIKKIIETQSSKAEFLVKNHSLQNRSALDFLYSHNQDGTVTIESYQGNEREIIIPEKLNGKKVTILADFSFEACYLKRVILPNTLVKIGFAAFDFNELTSIDRSEEHTSELQSRGQLVCRLL